MVIIFSYLFYDLCSVYYPSSHPIFCAGLKPVYLFVHVGCYTMICSSFLLSLQYPHPFVCCKVLSSSSSAWWDLFLWCQCVTHVSEGLCFTSFQVVDMSLYIVNRPSLGFSFLPANNTYPFFYASILGLLFTPSLSMWYPQLIYLLYSFNLKKNSH